MHNNLLIFNISLTLIHRLEQGTCNIHRISGFRCAEMVPDLKIIKKKKW